MAASRADLRDLPDWPCLLSREQAAAYLGVSVNMLESRIGNPFPEPIRIGGRKVFERFREGANPRMVLALELALHTGQRRGDVLAMQWRHIRNGLISVVQAKTGERLSIPIHSHLAAVLDRIPREHMFIVHREDGLPYTSSGFHAIYYREKKRLGLADLQFHGLRHTAARLLAEAGCTDREIMAILGHRTTAMVSRYTRHADQERLAKAAIVKLETRTKVSKPPDETV